MRENPFLEKRGFPAPFPKKPNKKERSACPNNRQAVFFLPFLGFFIFSCFLEKSVLQWSCNTIELSRVETHTFLFDKNVCSFDVCFPRECIFNCVAAIGATFFVRGFLPRTFLLERRNYYGFYGNKRSFRALGLMSVEVTRKKISRRKTMSVIDDTAKDASTFVFLLRAMAYFSSSWLLMTMSINWMVELSIL